MIAKIFARLVILFAAVPLAAAPAASQSPMLYPGERVERLAGYPAMVRFYKGDPAKPLLVFVPGSQHLARISYGCPACRPDDFIAYWLQKEGYNFLAVSYPVVSEHPAFDKAYPGFTAQVWGNQIALAAQQAIRENGLTNKVVMLHWSMAGKVIEPAAEASRKRGLEVEAAISLAASPGLPRETRVAMKMSAAGIVHKDDDYQDWLGQLRADDADNEGRTIIPPSTYTKEFVGDMAVNLQGNGEVYRDGAFVEDTNAQTRDYGVFRFSKYPLIAILMDDRASDPLHALGDSSAWEFFNGRTVSRLGAAAAKTLTPDRWNTLVALERTMDVRLRTTVGGNHFFFVGAKGARKSAEAIDHSIQAVRKFKEDWTAITGQPFE